MDSLLRLASAIDALEAAWEREPLASKSLGDFDDVLSLTSIESLLSSGLPSASVRLLDRGRRLPSERLIKVRERGAGGRDSVVDSQKVAEAVLDGATLILEELQTFSPAVAEFAAAVQARTGYDTYCAVFVTPGGARGAELHYDTVSVFIRQVHGSKRWRVTPPARQWPSREWASGDDIPTEPVLDLVLNAGDCLYIPRGFGHVGDATEEASAHLSIGLKPPTWGALLLKALAAGADALPELREAVPPRFAAADRSSLLQERHRLLGGALAELDLESLSPLRPATAPAPTGRTGWLAPALSGRTESGHDQR